NKGLSWLSKKEKDKAKVDFDKAILYFDKLIKANPNESSTYIYRGNAYYNRGDYPEAIEDYTKSINLKSSFLLAYYNKGLACYANKNYDAAIESYDYIIIRSPRYTNDIYIHRGNAYKAKKNYTNAIADYSKAIRLNPNNGNAYYSRGLAKKDNKEKLAKIKKDFDKYLELIIDDNEIWTKYAKYYIDDLKERLSDKKLSNIVDLISQIKEVLHIEDEFITHYTSLSVLNKLILEDSKFRISEGNFMNDPSEGKEFFKFLNYKPNTSCNENSKLERYSPKPFIGSFVTANKCDDLNMWR
ncbi:MAG: tetratricopeptide repeat protein, partial [Prolixibacteraceae bacterium]|nr:tetratricopeptide repeat protein [Prolixibacteraceae bacterium]